MRLFQTLRGWWLAASLLMPLAGLAQTAPSEYHLKAAFVYNFAKFIEWPPESFSSNTSELVIGIIGKNPFGDELTQTIQSKTVNGRGFIIRNDLRSVIEATNCHILFICSSEKARLPEIISGLAGTTVLTVAETDGFITAGGMINFVREGNKIRFEINDDAAKKVRIKISSKLLGLAMNNTRSK